MSNQTPEQQLKIARDALEQIAESRGWEGYALSNFANNAIRQMDAGREPAYMIADGRGVNNGPYRHATRESFYEWLNQAIIDRNPLRIFFEGSTVVGEYTDL